VAAARSEAEAAVAAAQAEVESARVEARRAREEERTFGGAAAKRVEVAKADATELNSLLQVRSQAHIEAPWTQTADRRRGIASTAPQCAGRGAAAAPQNALGKVEEQTEAVIRAEEASVAAALRCQAAERRAATAERGQHAAERARGAAERRLARSEGRVGAACSAPLN
jgi:hypothetical protein